MIDFPSVEQAQCPYPTYERMRAESRVYQVPGRDEFVLSHYDDVVYAAQHPELFSNFGAYPDPPSDPRRGHVVESDPPLHGAKRALLYAPLTPGSLRRHEADIRRFVDQLIDGFIADGSVEFASAFASPLPVLAICHLLGVPCDRTRLEWFRGAGSTTSAENRYRDAEVVALANAYREEIDGMARTALRRHEPNPREGILGDIIRAKVLRDGSWTVDEMVSDVSVLISGGNKTTAHLLASGMLLLLGHPEQLGAVMAHPSLLPRMVDEMLRCESPLQWVPRVCTRDTELAGQRIPAGARVLLLLGSGNRDPGEIPNPDDFQVGRPEARRHLAFGHGIHFCLGAPLARLEAAIAFERLLSRLKNLRLAAGTEVRYLESTQMRAPVAVPLEFDPGPSSGLPPLFA